MSFALAPPSGQISHFGIGPLCSVTLYNARWNLASCLLWTHLCNSFIDNAGLTYRFLLVAELSDDEGFSASSVILLRKVSWKSSSMEMYGANMSRSIPSISWENAGRTEYFAESGWLNSFYLDVFCWCLIAWCSYHQGIFLLGIFWPKGEELFHLAGVHHLLFTAALRHR